MRKAFFLIVVIPTFLTGILGACKADDVVSSPSTDTTGIDTASSSVQDSLFYVYKSASEGYSCFRIPAIIRSQKGTLLAFAEARKNNCGDAGDIDLVLKRSLDGGKTWSRMITVWDDADNTCGNPVPVVDQSTGTIWLLMTWNLGQDAIDKINNGTSKDTRRVFVTHSEDDGLTWAAPKEITDNVKRISWGWYATGPCHGIQIQNGKYAGRIVVPCDYITVKTKEGSSHVIYSDDHGQSWMLGGIIQQFNVNESSVAELSDGSLMLSMRSSTGSRMVALSTDGGLSWSDAQPDPSLPDPGCQGSLLSYPKKGLLFFSNPSSKTSRVNMTLRLSENDGTTWGKAFRVHSGPSAYSDIVMIDDAHVGILYEAGLLSPYEGLAFKVIAIKDFK
ncbi:MAG: exo-alpha-sialidase [Acidobacterium ailaaui]|nr:exo-alpha-sialidase [Pseudacidobacterium ailaaui]